MKATIIKTIILPLLLIMSAEAIIVWLLPTKVTLFIVTVVQLLTLVAVGTIIRKNSTDHEQDS